MSGCTDTYSMDLAPISQGAPLAWNKVASVPLSSATASEVKLAPKALGLLPGALLVLNGRISIGLA